MWPVVGVVRCVLGVVSVGLGVVRSGIIIVRIWHVCRDMLVDVALS